MSEWTSIVGRNSDINGRQKTNIISMQPKKGERIRYGSNLQNVSQPLQVYALRLRDLWPRDQKVFAEKVESDTFRPSKTA